MLTDKISDRQNFRAFAGHQLQRRRRFVCQSRAIKHGGYTATSTRTVLIVAAGSAQPSHGIPTFNSYPPVIKICNSAGTCPIARRYLLERKLPKIEDFQCRIVLVALLMRFWC
jgi:hypothetical protein